MGPLRVMLWLLPVPLLADGVPARAAEPAFVRADGGLFLTASTPDGLAGLAPVLLGAFGPAAPVRATRAGAARTAVVFGRANGVVE